ncbi:MAG: c-type cytochrome [Chitinophagaceae bacterium]
MTKFLFILFTTITATVGVIFVKNPVNTHKKPVAIKLQNGGAELYNTYCSSCHLTNGKGMDAVYPGLVKSTTVLKDAKKTVQIILKGQSGVAINGVNYDVAMPPQDYLTDDQIAAIVNYVRNSWGNKAKPNITAAQVKAWRK